MKKILIFSATILMSATLFAQDAKFQAMFIYNFTRTLQWPADAQKGDFVIGVLGDSDIYKELKSFTSDKKVRGMQKITVKKVSANEAGKCHIIFLAKNKKDNVGEIVSHIKGKHTLLIAENIGMTEKGSGIAFKKDEGGIVKYQFNEANIKKQGISVSTSFREVGEKR